MDDLENYKLKLASSEPDTTAIGHFWNEANIVWIST